MYKYWGIVLAFIVFVSCKETKKVEPIEIAEIPLQEPIKKIYGFDLEEFHVVHDTVKRGDSFGKLMLQNNVDYPKIVTIS